MAVEDFVSLDSSSRSRRNPAIADRRMWVRDSLGVYSDSTYNILAALFAEVLRK
jgi:hypothetical protein